MKFFLSSYQLPTIFFYNLTHLSTNSFCFNDTTVRKVLFAGFPLAISVSAPTERAIRDATEFGITLVGFARDNRFNFINRRRRAIIGTTEIIVIAVLLFGASKVPQLARSFGQAMGEFKKAKREGELSYKKFEESVIGSEEEIPKEKVKAAAKTKGEEVNIKEVAAYMGIDTEAKTEEELKEEIHAKLEASKSESEKE